MAGEISSILNGSDDAGEADFINEESESKYLTLSWWLLHVGGKDRERGSGYVYFCTTVYLLISTFPVFL